MSRFLSSLWNPRFLIIISFFWFISRFASAGVAEFWQDSARLQASRWSSNSAFSKFDGFVSTLWGSVQILGRTNETEVERNESHKVLSVTFNEMKFKVPVFLKMKKSLANSNFAVKAPLMVIFPGIFSGTATDNTSSLFYARMFNRLGYHALVLPNSFSVEMAQLFGKAGLAIKPGQTEKEAEFYAAVLLAAKSLLRSNVTDISWMGFSYGTHLASATLTKMQQTEGFVVPKQLLLVSPPLDLKLALERLDQAMDETVSEYFEKGCQKYISSVMKLGADYFFARNGEALKPDTIRCSKSAVAQVGFQQSLVQTITALKVMPDVLRDAPGVDDSKVRFRNYIATVFPEVMNVFFTQGKGKFSYWTSQIKNTQILGLSSYDDFLNTPEEWKEAFQTGEQDSRSWLMLRWGGHGGFFPAVEFENILKAQFIPAQP